MVRTGGTMAAISYMQRREVSGRYVMRKSLPKSLAGKPVPEFIRKKFGDELVNLQTGCFKREIKISARTADVRKAKLHNFREMDRIARLIEAVERAMNAGPAHAMSPPAHILTEEAIVAIVASVQNEYWQWDEEERFGGDERRFFTSNEERAESSPLLEPLRKGPEDSGMELDHRLALEEFNAKELAEMREKLASGNSDAVHDLSIRHAKQLGLALDESNQIEKRKVDRAVLTGVVEILERINLRQQGRPVSFEMPKPKNFGPKFSEAFARWMAGGGGRDAHQPAENTILEARTALSHFTELYGDLRLGQITKSMARGFRDTIAKIPKNLPNELRALPIKDLLKRNLSGYPLRSSGTLNKSVTMLSAIITQSIKEGFMDEVEGFSNPFANLHFAKNDRFGEGRELFEPSELERLFALPFFRDGKRPAGGGGEAAFWFPLIGLMSGMRLDEIAGLNIGDLRIDEASGTWIFDVKPNDLRGLKTSSSRRFVPVHPELIRIGLLAYRQSVEASGQMAALWPDLTQTTQRRSQAWSKWFGRVLREEAGIEDKNKVFHSFRHTFKRMARDAEISEELHDALTGHAGGGGVGRDYGSGTGVKALARAIDRIEAPINLDGLMWKPGAVIRKYERRKPSEARRGSPAKMPRKDGKS